MIKLTGLSKKYGKSLVVDDASAMFPKGEVTSIIGPNGAGKSTLLSMASRLTESDAGEVIIGDRLLAEWDTKELAKHLAVLRQSNNINMRFTIRELVCFGRFPHSQGRLKDEDHKIVDTALEHLGITDIQNKYLDELSGGQRQMAFIAMVVAQDTDYVFLDEPLNNLDIKHSVEIMQTLRRLAHEFNKAVVIVIHDINFASCYSDNIVAMKKGQVVKSGKVSEVVEKSVMESIYEIPFEIREFDGVRICMYYSGR
ncbi:iron complex transport system ATP-binding protein [Vibrio crassostreae]|uniref:iron ABC transporter ATP-binding protein n=1 Tax=Vibrio crassostreae TaxID=246167 RepID=UPI00062F242B|nr:ATP-binding cassette domain-containing protein [Vibrio crassostreae]ROO72887.1 iron complex transport system ATP-binding protein [Vibrio crassostreae]ROP09978.1 iron complex transport system ATP-binding protein [Vibrio crassostreae]ROP15983.1 iron complex transport system ATP-binding protein [Vibrio crassostreae]ROP20946.1 iron complex transport system ATP-binding protein [Vibrio crassostreae]ROQ79613.1 iron complex transport system ATP-binding protein [Vibrio crassostreae]